MHLPVASLDLFTPTFTLAFYAGLPASDTLASWFHTQTRTTLSDAPFGCNAKCATLQDAFPDANRCMRDATMRCSAPATPAPATPAPTATATATATSSSTGMSSSGMSTSSTSTTKATSPQSSTGVAADPGMSTAVPSSSTGAVDTAVPAPPGMTAASTGLGAIYPPTVSNSSTSAGNTNTSVGNTTTLIGGKRILYLGSASHHGMSYWSVSLALAVLVARVW